MAPFKIVITDFSMPLTEIETAELEASGLPYELVQLNAKTAEELLAEFQAGGAGLRAVGELSVTYARDTADLTDRQNVQLHWIRVQDLLLRQHQWKPKSVGQLRPYLC